MKDLRYQLDKILYDGRYVPSSVFPRKMMEVVDITENRVYNTFFETEITMNKEYQNA